MDAFRTADEKRVFLKRVRKESSEITIARFFSEEDKASDDRNHCVPILDYFEDEAISGYGILVMPIFRKFDRPEFVSIDEALEFVRQTLEVRLSFPPWVAGSNEST